MLLEVAHNEKGVAGVHLAMVMLEAKRGGGRPREKMLDNLASCHENTSVSEMADSTRTDRRMWGDLPHDMDCKTIRCITY